MQEWLSKLVSQTDPVSKSLVATLARREQEQKSAAREALGDFNAKRWLKHAVNLDKRVHRLLLGSLAFQHLALERWIGACQLHETAMRTRREADLHQLRIGIKRFRYTVENFLPDQHKKWGRDFLPHLCEM